MVQLVSGTLDISDLSSLNFAYFFIIFFLFFFFFFFSSRRRHTRSLRDWSSDVCSSDLPIKSPSSLIMSVSFFTSELNFMRVQVNDYLTAFSCWVSDDFLFSQFRSEERRVGKECRSRWSWYH